MSVSVRHSWWSDLAFEPSRNGFTPRLAPVAQARQGRPDSDGLAQFTVWLAAIAFRQRFIRAL